MANCKRVLVAMDILGLKNNGTSGVKLSIMSANLFP